MTGHRDLRTTQRYVDALKRSNRPVSSLARTSSARSGTSSTPRR